MTRLRQDRHVLHGIASPVLTVLSGGDLQMVNQKLYARAGGPFLCAACRIYSRKNRCDAWTNALPRYLRIIKSRYGFYAIFYGSFMHVRSCGGSRAFGQATTSRMVFQGSGFSFDAGMLLSALLYASSAAFFFTWSSAFGASCCCLFPFAMAWAGAVTASKVIAIAAITVLILKSFRIWPNLIPTIPAFRLNAPTVLFITFEIFETGVLDFE